jgi:hypothetical protein
MDAAALSALAALSGSGIGGFASIGATWLTLHNQSRARRREQEQSRREQLFGEFIRQASLLYADALTHDKVDPSALVGLYAVKAQLRLFAAQATIDHADDVLELIVQTYYQPPPDFSRREARNLHDHDFLRSFTEACRRELEILA